METSVSPLPLPLWPMLALSLTLFAVTATAVTVSSQFTKQFYASSPEISPETSASALALY